MSWNVWSLTTERWMLPRSVRSKDRAVHAMETTLVPDNPGLKFEVRRIFPVLEQHGTSLMQLKPAMIWRMAMEDFDRRAHNKEAGVDGMKPYNFHRDHVVKAKTANDILRAAIEDPGRGQQSGKKVTRLMYANVELLKAALQ